MVKVAASEVIVGRGQVQACAGMHVHAVPKCVWSVCQLNSVLPKRVGCPEAGMRGIAEQV